MTTSSSESSRIIALHPLEQGPSPALSRLIDALRAQGAQVQAVAIPTGSATGADGAPPTLEELKAGLNSLAESVGAALRGDTSSSRDAVDEAIGTLPRVITAVVCTDARLARRAMPAVAKQRPDALRIAVEGDFHVDPAWRSVPFDALISPHPTLGAELGPIREGRARLYAGGPMVAADEAPRRLGTDKPNVVMSFSRLDPSEVDPLLFQLSLTQPERYHLLFLPSGRPSVDDLVRSRAGGYGLAGKRPRPGSDPTPWVRGADLVVGHPSPAEAAAAITAGVPQVLFTTTPELSGGDAFVVQHGLGLHAASALTVAVQVDHALPGGPSRGDLEDALARMQTDGPDGAAGCVLRAIRDGRPEQPAGAAAAPGGDDELEEIGNAPAHHDSGVIDERVREAYLREIIIQQRDLKRQIDRARAGVDTWNNRRRLAQRAGDERLEREATMRVEGIERVLGRLVRQERDAAGVRERFASGSPLSAADRTIAAQLLNPQAAATLDRLSRAAHTDAFERLEIDDALNELKRRMGRED